MKEKSECMQLATWNKHGEKVSLGKNQGKSTLQPHMIYKIQK